ncbi:serine O-acetyltransferase EpsC [Flavihumibacter petaseus]|uniref:Serine acetyltransferase n=1 Tax=Flavihumibacter petaseus NBRC 106054 TaxID=1220578 RepID=A0A0E9N273_9BACT|nr:serine O-acetyltransferase EpsC [Flavihumibacter petaseus]GAO43878.1 serine acetyltransferase [Flavihumibacter petaseus NBRC 106054]
MTLLHGYILSSSVPKKKQVIDFAQELVDYLFPVVENEKTYEAKHRKKLDSLKNLFSEILFAFSENYNLNQETISEQFFDSIDQVKADLLEDASALQQFDPAAKSLEEVVLTYPGFMAVTAYRVSNVLYRLGLPLVPRIISEWAHSTTGIDIHPGATIGVPFMIDHGTGVVIGETSVIGKNVKIYQGVTIGALAVKKEEAEVKRHPTIEDNVIVYANSTILGGKTVIGRESIIGGNCFIVDSVPALSLVYHQPIITVKNKKDFTEPLNWII